MLYSAVMGGLLFNVFKNVLPEKGPKDKPDKNESQAG